MNDPLPSWRQTAPAGLSLAAAMSRHRPPSVGPGCVPAASGAGAAAPYQIASALRRLPAAMQQIIRPNAAPNWRSAKVANMTPARVDSILDLGLSGDATGQWELFDLMEDTWPRLAKNLSEIKRTVSSMKWTVTPWAEEDEEPSAEAKQRAKLVSHSLWRMAPAVGVDEVEFTGMVHDLLDAWGKGVSVMEILWDEHTSPPFELHIRPRALQWVHPSNWGIGPDGAVGLRTTPTEYYLTRPYDAQDVIPFPDYKFLCGIKRAKSSAVLGSAMLRPLAWWWAASNFSASWLLNYAQLFGVPMRWAKYPAGADAALIANINSVLEDFGNSSFASMPEGTELTILDSNKTAGSSPQDGILDRANEYCDLLVLGQTLTGSSGGTGSQALGRVHERVKGDVLKAATDWVATVINQQLVTSILDLNYGDHENAPEVSGRPDTIADQVQDANRDAILLGAGMPLPKNWLYARHGVPLPKDDEELIGQPEALGLPGAGGEDGMDPRERNNQAPKEVQRAQSGGSPAAPRDTEKKAPTVQSASPALPTRPSVCRCLPEAVSATGQTPETPPDPTDAIAARKADALAAAFRGSLAPVRSAILASTSPDDARRRLAALYMDWSPVKVAEIVQEAFEMCAVAGLGDAGTVDARFSEDQPRDSDGKWSAVGGSKKLTATKERAFSGDPRAVKAALSKQEVGALGEQIVMEHLKLEGAKGVMPVNDEQNNYAIDVISPPMAVEIKSGLVSNGETAQHWRATIGQPGKAETAALAKMSRDEKRAWNETKAQAIMDRKNKAVAEKSKQVGRKLKPVTMTTIIDPDRRVVDVYRFDGFHHRIAWNSETAKKGYVASYKF